MCGIAGATGSPDVNIKVKKMLVALEHRGSDACGTYQAKNLSIGNTLLKISFTRAEVCGVNSDGLIITVQPAATAATKCCTGIIYG